MLVDTDVLIEFQRDNLRAVHRLDQLSSFMVSAVTWMELFQGCRSKREISTLESSLRLRDVELVTLTPSITRMAIGLRDTYALAQGLRLADALIAATALEHQECLLTGNTKHFRCVEGLRLEKFEAGEGPGYSVHERITRYNELETTYRVVDVED